ncbi:MAG: sigma-70 family RNA polymerase sigma factor [Planctomycetota bacterium]
MILSDPKDEEPDEVRDENGDENLDEVLERQLPALERFVRGKMGAELSAQEASADIVQSVCREWVQADFEYRNEDALRAWLFRAALTKIHNHSRVSARRRARPDLRSNLDLLISEGRTPSSEVVERENLRSLFEALKTLPLVDQRLIEWVYLAEMPHKQAADRLGITPAASRQRLARALARLSQVLSKSQQKPD